MNSRHVHGVICLALIALTALCLGRVLGNDFVNIDDPHYVTANPVVQAGLTGPSLYWAWTTSHAGFCIPLTWMSLELDATLYWPNSVADANRAAWGFHLTNLLLHLVNTLLVYRLMWKLTGSVGNAALIAALFGVHPLHVESVAWVTERKDVLSGCFGLLALLAYLHYRERPGMLRMLLVCGLFEMSLLAKPVLVALPVIMLLLDWLHAHAAPHEHAAQASESGAACSVLEKLPLFGLALLCTWITIQTQREAGATALVEVPLPWRLANAAVSYERYLAKAFWPVDLAVFYPHPRTSLTAWQIGEACLVLTGATVLVVCLRKRVPAMLVGWLWFLIALTPNIGLIQAGAQGMADRFTYFALLGLFLALVSGLDCLARQWRINARVQIAVAAVLVAALGVLTWRQAARWENCRTLYEHALSVTVDSADIHRYYGIYLFSQGDSAGAEQQLAKALAAGEKLGRNKSFDLHLYYGAVLHKTKDWRGAIEHLEKAIQLKTDEAMGHYLLADSLLNLGRSLWDQGERPEAWKVFGRAMDAATDPGQRTNIENVMRNLAHIWQD